MQVYMKLERVPLKSNAVKQKIFINCVEHYATDDTYWMHGHRKLCLVEDFEMLGLMPDFEMLRLTCDFKTLPLTPDFEMFNLMCDFKTLRLTLFYV